MVGLTVLMGIFNISAAAIFTPVDIPNVKRARLSGTVSCLFNNNPLEAFKNFERRLGVFDYLSFVFIGFYALNRNQLSAVVRIAMPLAPGSIPA